MKASKTAPKEAKAGDSPSKLIDARIAALGGWRGEILALVRKLIKQSDPDVVEEVARPVFEPIYWVGLRPICGGQAL